MGLFDKLKGKASDHSDKVEQGMDKAGDAASKATGGKHDDKIESGKDTVRDHLGGDENNDEDSNT